MMPNIPITGLPCLVNGQIVQVVVEKTLGIGRLELPYPNTTAENDCGLAFAQVAIRLRQNRLAQ